MPASPQAAARMRISICGKGGEKGEILACFRGASRPWGREGGIGCVIDKRVRDGRVRNDGMAMLKHMEHFDLLLYSSRGGLGVE
jgi:hypothetical protein